MSNFPSTLLAQTNDPKEIQKADLDLLDKINQISQQARGQGPFVPLLPDPIIAGEPSFGTPHPTSDANRTATLVVNTSTNTAGVWSAAVTMTGVPAGAKAAFCVCYANVGANAAMVCVEAATGYTLSDITIGTNNFKYHGTWAQVSNNKTYAVLKIHLDANRQFKWCTNLNNSTVQIGSAIDYEM
jgi:hypothetical protein